MIENIDISGSNYDVEESLQKYVQKRIECQPSFWPPEIRENKGKSGSSEEDPIILYFKGWTDNSFIMNLKL